MTNQIPCPHCSKMIELDIQFKPGPEQGVEETPIPGEPKITFLLARAAGLPRSYVVALYSGFGKMDFDQELRYFTITNSLWTALDIIRNPKEYIDKPSEFGEDKEAMEEALDKARGYELAWTEITDGEICSHVNTSYFDYHELTILKAQRK